MLEFKLDLPQASIFHPGEEKDQLYDLIILGGGPAGLTAAVYASRKQMNAVLVSPDLGGQVLATSGVENYMGYQYITGPELSKKFSAQIQKFPLKLIEREKATEISQRPDGQFIVRTDAGHELAGRSLILATGKRWKKMNVPGEDIYQGRGVAVCAICDAPFFKHLPVVVAGGGNSAVTAAIDLLQVGSPVTLVNFSDGWQADPVLLERIQGRVTLLDKHRILEVLGDGQRVTGVKLAPRDGGAERVLPVQGVFVEIGLIPNTEVFKDFVVLNPQQEVVVDCATHTSRAGVYGAGDCTNVPEKQIIIAAADGAKAALAAYKFITYPGA